MYCVIIIIAIYFTFAAHAISIFISFRDLPSHYAPVASVFIIFTVYDELYVSIAAVDCRRAYKRSHSQYAELEIFEKNMKFHHVKSNTILKRSIRFISEIHKNTFNTYGYRTPVDIY